MASHYKTLGYLLVPRTIKNLEIILYALKISKASTQCLGNLSGAIARDAINGVTVFSIFAVLKLERL